MKTDLSGVNNPFYGKKHSKKTRIKMSETHKKQYAESPELRKKLSDAAKGKKQTPEQQEKKRIGMKRAYQRILDEAEKLKEQGYKVVPIAQVIPDIIGFKDGKVYAFEVEYGKPRYNKYEMNDFKKYYDKVVWLLRTPDPA